MAQRPSEGVLPVYPLRLDQTKRGFWNESREARFQCDDRDRTRLSTAPDQTGECSSCGFLFPTGMCPALCARGTASAPAGAASQDRKGGVKRTNVTVEYEPGGASIYKTKKTQVINTKI